MNAERCAELSNENGSRNSSYRSKLTKHRNIPRGWSELRRSTQVPTSTVLRRSSTGQYDQSHSYQMIKNLEDARNTVRAMLCRSNERHDVGYLPRYRWSSMGSVMTPDPDACWSSDKHDCQLRGWQARAGLDQQLICLLYCNSSQQCFSSAAAHILLYETYFHFVLICFIVH